VRHIPFALLLVGVLTACSTGSSGPPVEDLIAKATESSNRASTVSVTQTLRIPGSGAIRTDAVARDLATGPDVRYHLTRTGPGGGPPNEAETLLVDDALFAKQPPSAGGKPWRPLREPPQPPGISQSDQLRQAGNPVHQFAQLAAGSHVDASEPDQVGGRPATRYTMSVDTARATPRLSNMLLRSVLGSAQQNGVRSIRYHVWIGPGGLPLRSEFAVPMPSLPGAPTAHGREDYSRWGQPVRVTAPAADELTP
jgi:hypothetical protein